MTMIDGIGRPAAPAVIRRRKDAGGFALPAGFPSAPDAPASEASAPGASVPIFTAYMEGLLGLQEQGPPEALSLPAARDREARRHGQALLSTLAELQWLLLGTDAAPGVSSSALQSVLEHLGELAESIPAAADPGLRGIVAAIGLRAQVELARRTA